MNDLSSLSDSQLVIEVKNGNFNAFENLVYRHDKQVLSIAAHYVNNAEDAKDIYQEVFLRVYRNIGKFQYRSEFTTWLYRITTNVCLTYCKKHRRHQDTTSYLSDERQKSSGINRGGCDDSMTSSQRIINSEISDRVTNALNLLSPQQKLIFMLRHYEGYKLKEIAGFMKCSEGAVKKQLFTAIHRLRDDLRDLYLEGVLR
jgi:RNA polymerase sigma-70 factor (ECF subfamily)